MEIWEDREGPTQSCYNILSKMSSFKKKVWDMQRDRKASPIHWEENLKADHKTTCESDQTLDLTGKTQSSLYKYVQRIKETIGLP